jgi:hypothetical protein
VPEGKIGSSVESSISIRPEPKRNSESVHQDLPVDGGSDVSTAISASGPDSRRIQLEGTPLEIFFL